MLNTISYYASRGQSIDYLCNKSPYELMILQQMKNNEEIELFNLISKAVMQGYLKARAEIAKAIESSGGHE